MSTHSKIFILVAIVSVTFFFSYFSKREFDHMKGSVVPVLQALPDVPVKIFKKGTEELEEKSSSALLGTFEKGLFVHYWGTWCAPCEVEFPEFLEFARKFENQKVGFLIIAVNDEIKKVNKFLKRFKDVPSNIVFALDEDSKTMDYFGTVKVPETYLFNKDGKHLTKFVGPQDWGNSSFYKRSSFLLDSQKEKDIKQISTN